MPSTGCPAMWNSLIGIEFAIFFDEFLIFDNFSNPGSTYYCDYRGCLTQIINGPPEKFFVVSSSTTATGPFHSTYPVRSLLRLLIPDAWLKSQPWLSHVQGHVAAGLDEFRFPGTPHHVHYTSALASYCVDFAVYEVQVHERLRKWCLHHGLPLDQFHAPLMEHLRSQFQQHRQHASTHQLLTCPQLYFKGLHNTWLQSGTFAATTLKPDQAEAIILKAIPRHLQQRYKWAYRKKTTSIPVAKVFLKRKKQWKSGRTIIAYHKVVHRLLFKAVAILLGEIAADTWKCSWGIHPTPRIWQNIKQYLDNTDDTVTLAFHNDDLVGFFNSVPQDQVCAAVEQLLAEHQRGRPSFVYSVETQAAANYNRVFAGKQSYGRTPTTRIIHMEDILAIVKSSFQCMYVQVGTLIMRQVHGTAIDSQLSPVLSHICVARHEVMDNGSPVTASFWSDMWTTDLSSSLLQPQVTRQPHWRHCSRLTFTVLISCWNKCGLQSSSASSSMWATGRFTTKPLAKSGR